MNIRIFEKEEIHIDAIRMLEQNGHRAFYSMKGIGKNEILAIFIRTQTKVNSKLLDQFPRLKYVLRAGVGLDNIDLIECQKREIKVINAPGSNANSVAEFTIALMLMLSRNVMPQITSLRAGNWRKKELEGEELSDKIIGLVGGGAVGRLVASKLSVFGIKKIIGYDPYLDKKTLLASGINKCTLKKVLTAADIISLHLPLNPKTKNLITFREISLMKRSAFLINTSRGGIVNERDLISAIKKKIIKGAALDVFETEPKVDKKLLQLKNIITTPHIAAYTKQANRNMSVMPVMTFLADIEKN